MVLNIFATLFSPENQGKFRNIKIREL